MEKSSKFKDFKDFFQFLASIKGDLANITAPPYFLAPLSVVEGGSSWTCHLSAFAAAAHESTPERRMLAILKWTLIAVKPQFYVGGAPGTSIKKPLNPFLGEVFLGTWNDGKATAHLVVEQVSHHPPISAVYMWDEENGIQAEWYTRIGMTFSGTLDIRQTGHGTVRLEKWDEDYLTPTLNGCVKGFLSGRLYPEVFGTYHIPSTSGFVSEIEFSGSGLFWGRRNSFRAKMYRVDDPAKTAVYKVEGQWSDTFAITDGTTGEVLELYDTNDPANAPAPLSISDIEDQDAWESRRAWRHVLDALGRGDIGDIITEKSKLERAQRKMRAEEAKQGQTWKPLFFVPLEDGYKLWDNLAPVVGWKLQKASTKGIWKIDVSKVKSLKKPFRGDLTPLG